MDTSTRLQQVHSPIHWVVFLFGLRNAWELIRGIKFRFFFTCDILIHRLWLTRTASHPQILDIGVDTLAAHLDLASFVRILATSDYHILLIVPLLN